MTKIVFIGAGSIIFIKNLIGDCLLTPSLRDAEIALVDIDSVKLGLSEKMLKNLNANINDGRASIVSYSDRRKALEGADFVIDAIQVGGYDPCVINDHKIPMKYGLRQTYGDTLGIGGIFRGLRTIPVMLEIARDIEEVCPNAWLLNYTNPMCIITGAIQRYTKVKTIGLCHSVQICAKDLLEGLGMSTENVTCKIAGINHQAWLLNVHRDGVDLYPEIKIRAQNRVEKHNDMVRYEIMKRFGFYVTESSLHSSEYLPYFIKSSYPDILDEFGILTEMYKDWGRSQKEYWEKTKAEIVDNTELTHTRTHEYASYIMDAIKTDKAYKIGANVLNKGFITNLANNSCVEVPCLVDGSGITPCFIGDLPIQCAALNTTNINVQLLTIEAAMTHKKEYIYHAAMLDPHTSSELPLDRITEMCDDLLSANKEWLPEYK